MEKVSSFLPGEHFLSQGTGRANQRLAQWPPCAEDAELDEGKPTQLEFIGRNTGEQKPTQRRRICSACFVFLVNCHYKCHYTMALSIPGNILCFEI